MNHKLIKKKIMWKKNNHLTKITSEHKGIVKKKERKECFSHVKANES